MISLLVSSPHVVRNIVSFCEDGRSCYFFGLTCRDVFGEFKNMLSISSHLYHRLAFANRDLEHLNPSRKDGGWESMRSFNIFDPPSHLPLQYTLDPRIYTTNIEEYESHFKDEVILKRIILDVVGDINKKNGGVCMIAGSYAMLGLLKRKNFIEHSKYLNELFELKMKEINQWIHRGSVGGPNVQFMIEHDIDVFILGENKKEISEQLLLELSLRTAELIPDEKLRLQSHKGCTDLYHFKPLESRSMPNVVHHKFSKTLQLILKKNANTPFDIFSFFDLDCCCIGYFPGLSKVVGCSRFIKSATTFMNHADFQYRSVSGRHKDRITKYFFRLGIRTSIELPHPMTFFHTYFKNVHVSCKSDYVSLYPEYATWGDFKISKSGEVRRIPTRNLKHRERYSNDFYNVNSGEHETFRMFHFVDPLAVIQIPHETDKKIELIYYSNQVVQQFQERRNLRLEEGNEGVFLSGSDHELKAIEGKSKMTKEKEMGLIDFDTFPKLFFRRDVKNYGLLNKQFEIGDADFSYYYICFGIKKDEKTGRYGYNEKIFPRHVKALLTYDMDKNEFKPLFLRRYRCGGCGKVSVSEEDVKYNDDNNKNKKKKKRKRRRKKRLKFYKAFQRCSQCKKIWYCSVQCQNSHWKVHKKDCSK